MNPERWHVRLEDGSILHFDDIESADVAAMALVGEPVEILIGNSGILYVGPRRMANVLA